MKIKFKVISNTCQGFRPVGCVSRCLKMVIQEWHEGISRFRYDDPLSC